MALWIIGLHQAREEELAILPEVIRSLQGQTPTFPNRLEQKKTLLTEYLPSYLH